MNDTCDTFPRSTSAQREVTRMFEKDATSFNVTVIVKNKHDSRFTDGKQKDLQEPVDTGLQSILTESIFFIVIYIGIEWVIET